VTPGTAASPFSGDVPETIPLHPPPLAQVLVQVRFSAVASIVLTDFFAPFQQALIDKYPLARKDQEIVLINPQTGAPPQTAELWRMADESETWRVTLAAGFVTLECRRYPGNKEFFARLDEVLTAVATHIRPRLVERLGVRYVNRLEDDEDLKSLTTLIRPEILGLCALTEDGVRADLALTQSAFSLNDVQLAARWGILPPSITTDPGLEAVPHRSWLLDIDVSDAVVRPFDVEQLSEQAFDYSRIEYRFFRWAINPAFLARFGAEAALVSQL
jgi:uncharacterized protein (TIGR04255 family)